MSLTEDRIATKLTRLSKDCINIYELCKTKPSNELWSTLDALESKLQERLTKRPISPLEIDAAVFDHRKQFQALCAGKIKW